MVNRSFILIFCILLVRCKYDKITPPEIYLEGQQIHGVEMQVPWGLYDGLPLTPKISPDSSKLLYREPYGSPEPGLWVMDLNTQVKTLLYINGRSGDWSPDNQWIAFNINNDIYKVKVDGSQLTQLTQPFEVTIGTWTYVGNSYFPDWSPDGNEIAYYLSIDYRSGEAGCRSISPDGNFVRKIFKASEPDWSPDGTNIMGITGVSSTSIETQLLIYNLLSGDSTALRIADDSNKNPKYSPDGSKIVFCNYKGIYVIDSDGHNLKRIIPNHLYNNDYHGPIKLWAQNASWHPDGKHIIYEHLVIDEAVQTNDGLYIKGTMSFYKVNDDSAIMVSNLELNDI